MRSKSLLSLKFPLVVLTSCLTFSQVNADLGSRFCKLLGLSPTVAADEFKPSLRDRFQAWRVGADSPKELATYLELKEFVENGFSEAGRLEERSNPTYGSYLTVFTKTREWLNKASDLNSAAQKSLVTFIRDQPYPSESVRHIRDLFLLAMFDERAWINLAKDVRSGTSSVSVLIPHLREFERRLPASTREMFLHMIGENYYSSSTAFDSEHELAPKRVVDWYFKEIGRGDLLIQNAIEGGKTPWEAFSEYWALAEKHLEVRNPYTPELFLELLRDIRYSLMEYPPSVNVTAPVIFVGGSLPNGRGNLENSDMDASANFMISEKLLDEMTRRALRRVRPLAENTKFHIAIRRNDDHFIPNSDRDFWGHKHTVAFRVGLDGIDMLVYRPTDEDKVLSDEVDPTNPTINVFVYRIE